MHVYKSCDLIERPEVVLDQQSSDNFVINPAIDNDTGMDAAIFLAQDGAALTLNDLWLRIEDQMKIFETVPKDDKELHSTPPPHAIRPTAAEHTTWAASSSRDQNGALAAMEA